MKNEDEGDTLTLYIIDEQIFTQEVVSSSKQTELIFNVCKF